LERVFGWEKKQLSKIFKAELREDSGIVFVVDFAGKRIVVAAAAVGVPSRRPRATAVRLALS
jgi:hypothetical protein